MIEKPTPKPPKPPSKKIKEATIYFLSGTRIVLLNKEAQELYNRRWKASSTSLVELDGMIVNMRNVEYISYKEEELQDD